MFQPPKPFLVGMIHLPPLPGSPNHTLSVTELTERALADARTLAESGFDALLIENFGDSPFSADRLEPAAVASMGVIAAAVHSAVSLPIGINALRNDALSALGVAAAAGASFIRVNVHTGVAATDQGMIQGRADETLRTRQRLNPDIGIFADVHVKHSVPVNQPDIGLAAEETAYRGQADAIIVTGSTTGRSADLDHVRRVKQAVPDRPVLVGSGATAETIRDILGVADGVIVGTSLRNRDRQGPQGRVSPAVDPHLAEAFIRAARG